MRKRFAMFLVAWAAAFPLLAADGDLLAETAVAATFDVRTFDNATFVAKSAAEIAALMPVTWRTGDTVDVIPPQGAASTLVTDAASAGSTQFAPDAGGIWTLVNSAQGKARIGVAWSVYGDGGMLVTSGNSPEYAVDSLQEGPNREIMMKKGLPVAYSGDLWHGSATASSTLTVTQPSGASEDIPLVGAGVYDVPFNKAGRWRLSLVVADATLESEVDVKSLGFQLIFW